MTSRRATFAIYGVIAFMAVAFPLFLVNFPEYGPQIEFVLTRLVIVSGIGFVIGGLFQRDPSLLVVGAGFLMAMYGTIESIRWMTLLGSPITLVGLLWLIKKQAARA
jgi:hypothetical protein